MPTINKKYGLFNLKTNDIVKYYTEDNTGHSYAGCETAHYLDDTYWRGEDYWLVDDYETALMAKWTSESWYNAKYDTPVNPFHPKDLSVIIYYEVMHHEGDMNVEDEVKKVNQMLRKQGYGELSERLVRQVLENEGQ